MKKTLPATPRNQKTCGIRHHAATTTVLAALLASTLPQTGAGVVITFKAGATDLNAPTSYTNNTGPTSTTDVRLATPAAGTSSVALTLSTGPVTMQSLNISTGNVTTAYTIQNTTAGSVNTTLTLDNTAGNNTFGGFVKDLIYLNTGATGNLTLTIQGANGSGSGGTGTLGVVLASSGNFDTTVGTTLNVNAPISGNFNVTKIGTGTLNLSGNNTFSGSFLANAGTTNLGANGALGGATVVTVGTTTATVVATLGLSATALNNGASLTNTINDAAAVTINTTMPTPTTTLGGVLNLAGGTETLGSLATAGTAPAAASLVIGDYTNPTTMAVTAGGVTVGNGTSTTFGGIISGAHTGAGTAFTKQGLGTLTLAGPNTFTGGVALNEGVLNLGVGEVAGTSGPLGASGAISFGGGTLQYSASNNFDYSSRFSTADGQVYSIDTNSQLITFAAPLAGVGSSLNKIGANTLILSSGASTFTGGVVLGAGNVRVTGAENPGVSGPLGASGAISFTGGALQYSTLNQIDYSSRFSTADGQLYNISTNSQTIEFFSPLTSNGGSLTKSAAGFLYLSSSASTFNAGVNLTAGTVRVNAPENPGVSGPLGVTGPISFTGGILQYSAANTFDYSPRFSTTDGQKYNINTNTFNVELASPLTSNGGTLTKSSSGVLILSNSGSTFNGGVTLGAGSVRLNAAEIPGVSGPLGSGGTITFNGGNLQFSPLNGFDYSPRFSSAAGQAYNIDTNGMPVTLASPLTSPDGSLTKIGTSILTLSGANTFAGGVTINAGTLQLRSTEMQGVSGPLGASGTILFNGGTLQFTTVNTFDYSPRFSTAANQNFNLNTGTPTVTLASALVSTGGTLNKTGTGTLILSGANTFTGNATLTTGTVNLGGVETPGVSGPLGTGNSILFRGGALQFSTANTYDYSSRFAVTDAQLYSIDTNGQTVTFATGMNSNNGTLTKSGPGLLNLSVGNTYNAGTTVTGGILQVSNPAGTSATGSGQVTVNAAATLQGTGYIDAGTNLITIRGTLSPGSGTGSFGSLNFIPSTGVGSMTLAATAILAFDLTTAAGQDLITLGGSTLTISGSTLALNLPDLTSTGIDYTARYQLFTGVTSLSGTGFATVTGYDSTDYQAVFTLNGTEYDLSFVPVPVPEPSAITAGLLLAGAACWRGRRSWRERLAA